MTLSWKRQEKEGEKEKLKGTTGYIIYPSEVKTGERKRGYRHRCRSLPFFAIRGKGGRRQYIPAGIRGGAGRALTVLYRLKKSQ
jgi:hypothetical protein